MMGEVKLVINDVKQGKSYQRVMDNSILLGKKINDIVNGNSLGLSGYELKITGGSDKSGFPMRVDLESAQRKSILITKGIGLRRNNKGLRKRKMVRGNTVSDQIAQLNLKVEKYGQKSLIELFGIKPRETQEGKNAEKPVQKG